MRFFKLCGSLSSQKAKQLITHTMQVYGGSRIITPLIFNPMYIIHTVVPLYINKSIAIRTKTILNLTTAFGKCDLPSTDYFLAESLGEIKVNIQCLRPS